MTDDLGANMCACFSLLFLFYFFGLLFIVVDLSVFYNV